VAPRTLVEERLAGILCPLLQLEKVSVEDNFFMLGGHSLLGTQLIARIRDTFGVGITLRALFDNPTVAGISAEIEQLILAKLETSNGAEHASASHTHAVGDLL
jgi:acyl carrier protein